MVGIRSKQPCPPHTSIIAALLGQSQPSGFGINHENIRDKPVPGPSPWGGDIPDRAIVMGLVSISNFLQAMQSVGDTWMSVAASVLDIWHVV
jgi:hypothetical protein